MSSYYLIIWFVPVKRIEFGLYFVMPTELTGLHVPNKWFFIVFIVYLFIYLFFLARKFGSDVLELPRS